MSGAERIEVESRAELRRWLAQNHARPDSVWLVTYKKHVPDKHVSWDAVVEEALCFGWIDSLPRKLDADRTMVRLSPRRRGSAWSGVNKARIERLLAAGMVEPPGLQKIAEAKADGSWSMLDAADAPDLPADLAAALDRRPGARARFAALPRSSRRATLEWILQAKRPETRMRRVEETAARAERGERAR